MHDITCPRCGFTSTGWPTQEAAEARLEEHLDEHATGEPAPELVLSVASTASYPEEV